MRIKSVRMQNFRVFQDETVFFDDYTCLVGANGVGKSTVLAALNVFFGEKSNATDVEAFEPEDFHDRSKDIEIEVTFSELSQTEQDALSDYARNGELVVSAKAEAIIDRNRAEVKQFGSRPGVPEFGKYFAAMADGRTKADELKAIYLELRTAHPELPAPARSKDATAGALREYEAGHPELCELLPSSDQFYGFQGTGKLAPFVQWVYVPAVKDARGEQSEDKANALGKLLKRAADARSVLTEEIEALKNDARVKYSELVRGQQASLDGLSSSIAKRLQTMSHPGAGIQIRWVDSDKSVNVAAPSAALVAGEHGFMGNVARLGHGLQRAMLVALLQELSEYDKPDAPKLIMGFEEPELHQHPPQVRHIANVLQELVSSKAQVVVTTHSPLFVTGEYFESVRLVRRRGDATGSAVERPNRDEISKMLAAVEIKTGTSGAGVPARLQTILLPQSSEIFFAPKIVLVEGVEDAAYIGSYLGLEAGKVASRFRELGIHVVPANKKSELEKLLAITTSMQIDAFAIFDCDDDCKEKHRPAHATNNERLFGLLGQAPMVPFPQSDLFGDSFVAWQYNMTKAVEGDVPDWSPFLQAAEVDFGQPGSLDKNPLFIGRKLALAWEAGHRFPTLQRLVLAILTWAEKSEAPRSRTDAAAA